ARLWLPDVTHSACRLNSSKKLPSRGIRRPNIGELPCGGSIDLGVSTGGEKVRAKRSRRQGGREKASGACVLSKTPLDALEIRRAVGRRRVALRAPHRFREALHHHVRRVVLAAPGAQSLPGGADPR